MTFAVGQMIVRGAIEPALELKRLIAAIASDLDFMRTNFSPGRFLRRSGATFSENILVLCERNST
jgi:hypothetical protein